jgi:hypothetical protein
MNKKTKIIGGFFVLLFLGAGILLVWAGGQEFTADTFDTGNPGGDPEYYIASKENLVVSEGQVKLGEDCSVYECGESDGQGGCQARAAGDYDLPACKTCDGTSLEAVNYADGTQDSTGSNTCNTSCYACDGSGSCVAKTVDGASATALGCAAGEEACRRCDNGVCTYYTSGQHGCPVNQECDANGQCIRLHDGAYHDIARTTKSECLEWWNDVGYTQYYSLDTWTSTIYDWHCKKWDADNDEWVPYGGSHNACTYNRSVHRSYEHIGCTAYGEFY